MKVTERTHAEDLRRQGFTYREILHHVPVSKSTLSVWLRDVVLTEAQQSRIHGKNLQIRRRFVEYNRWKHHAAVAQHQGWLDTARNEISVLSQQDLRLVGAALYWAEGSRDFSEIE